MVNKQIVNVIMSAQIITLEDLYEFKTQLLEDIRIILNNQKDITSKNG